MNDPYVRLYWRFADEFPDVYQDDAAFALYGRLLRLADMAWPSLATLPYGARKAALAMLTKDREGGPLVEMVTASTYRVRGMEKERGHRAEAARTAARGRWADAPAMRTHDSGNAESMRAHTAVGNAESMPRPRPRPSQAETEPSQPGEVDALDVYHELTGWRPWGQWSGDGLKGAIRDYGGPATEAALRAEYAAEKDRGSLLKRTLTRLARDADRQREEAKARPKRTRKDDRAEIAAVMRDLYAPTEAAS